MINNVAHPSAIKYGKLFFKYLSQKKKIEGDKNKSEKDVKIPFHSLKMKQDYGNGVKVSTSAGSNQTSVYIFLQHFPETIATRF